MRSADIIVHFTYPPIPVRNFDWAASWDGDEPDDDGRMLVGYGRNPLDAIVDLLDSTEICEELANERAKKLST